MRISGHDCQRPKYKIKCHLIFWPKVSELITLLNALYFDVGVQGTCKYGTRVDYILASPNSPYKFVPGSYSVFSSKGTSDHHIVKVDLVKVTSTAAEENVNKKRRQSKQKVIKVTQSSPSKGIWKTNT